MVYCMTQINCSLNTVCSCSWQWYTETPRLCKIYIEKILCIGVACIASFTVDVCETDRKHLVVLAHCFPSYQFAFSSLHQKLAVV
jgi:hypothetical protein